MAFAKIKDYIRHTRLLNLLISREDKKEGKSGGGKKETVARPAPLECLVFAKGGGARWRRWSVCVCVCACACVCVCVCV
jgi:hypothetical protein